MKLFYVTQPLTFRVEADITPTRSGLRLRPASSCDGPVAGHRWVAGQRFDLPALVGTTATEATLYIGYWDIQLKSIAAAAASAGGGMFMVRRDAKRRALESAGLPRWPRDWGEIEEVVRLAMAGGARRPVRVAIVNEFSSALGDSIMLMGAVREFRRRLEQQVEVTVHLLQHPHYLEAEALWDDSGLIDGIVSLPAPLAVIRQFDMCFDVGVNWACEGAVWIDSALLMLGIEPQSVDASRKNSRGLVARRAHRRALPLPTPAGRRVLLFHHRASTPVRSMPDDDARRLVVALIKTGKWSVVSTCSLALESPHFTDLSPDVADMGSLIELLSSVAGFVSVDTSIYHLADALELPGVVVFSTIPPAERIAYYRAIEGLFIGTPSDGRTVVGLHATRNADLLAYAETLWATVDPTTLDECLERVIGQRTRVASRDVVLAGD